MTGGDDNPSSSIFPSELIESFFSLLQVQNVDHFDNGLATLKDCAMNCTLRWFAERHFYSSISVRDLAEDPYPGAFSAARLAELFVEQPHISNHVRHMTMVFSLPSMQGIEKILSKVLQLESIALVGDKKTLPWDSMQESFPFAFGACIKLPLMKTVVLANLKKFPLSVLDDCTCKNLIFRHVQLLIEPRLPLDGDGRSLSLMDSFESLTLYRVVLHNPQFEVWAEKRIHKLRSLMFSPVKNAEEFNTLSVLLSLCSNTLTSLDLDFSSTCRTIFGLKNQVTTPPDECIRFSLTTLIHLQQLTIGADVSLSDQRTRDYNYIHSENASALPTICELLMTSPPSLTQLTLYFRIHFEDDCNTAVLSEVDWQPLAKALNSPSLAIQQTRLHIQIEDTRSIGKITRTLCRSVDLSRLVEWGALVIMPVSTFD